MKEAIHLNAQGKDPTALCVDLDYTLVRTDTLYEQVILLFKASPLTGSFKLLKWSLRGKAFMKHQLASAISLDAAKLPYNQEVVSFLRQEQAKGRKIILASGAHKSIVHAVANHLRIFSESFGSREDLNLVGKNKAAFLEEKFGAKNFDYVGDSPTDLPVWAKARQAIVVSYSASLVRRAQKVSQVDQVIQTSRLKIKTFAKAIRCHQWLKNILVLLPVIFAQRFTDLETLTNTVVGFMAFCFAASSIYVINDLVDIQDDRAHPDKKKRPFASGDLPLQWAFVMAPLLLVAAIVCASYLSMAFQSILFGYLALTSAYNFWLKQVAVADIMVLATLFCGRLFAGSAASEIVLSPWLIAFTGFFFLSLAIVKRCSELVMLKGMKESHTRGRGYAVQDVGMLIPLGVSAGCLSVLVLALYLSSENARLLYEKKDYLWASCPLTLYWLSRVWLLTNRGEMHSDPISFALRDKTSWMVVATIFITWLLSHGYLL